jgi:plastocyanin
MKTLKSYLAISICGLFVFCSIQVACASENKEEAASTAPAIQIIRMHYIGSVSPGEVTIVPGTTVVWVNNSRATLEIQFEGKQVTTACKSPVHFVLDEQGSFISNRIPEGSVASLCFLEKGEFNYVARKAWGAWSGSGGGMPSRENIKEFKGKVIVK